MNALLSLVAGGENFINSRRERFGVATVEVCTITLHWRGVWSPAFAADLLARATVLRRDLAVISTSVLIGNIAAFNIFNRSTARVRSR